MTKNDDFLTTIYHIVDLEIKARGLDNVHQLLDQLSHGKKNENTKKRQPVKNKG